MLGRGGVEGRGSCDIGIGWDAAEYKRRSRPTPDRDVSLGTMLEEDFQKMVVTERGSGIWIEQGLLAGC